VGSMLRCSSCDNWVHDVCAFVTGPVYICDFCGDT
jgi:hypothetical protein